MQRRKQGERRYLRLATIFPFLSSPTIISRAMGWPVMRPPSPASKVVTSPSDGAIISIPAKMNYVTPETQIVSSRRDLTGSDSTLNGVEWSAAECRIGNARGRGFSLNANGFELRQDQLATDIDFFDHDDVVNKYYPSCEKLVTQTLLAARQSGAGEFSVRAFDHNVRSTKSSEREIKNSGGGTVQTPVAVVHGDYTRVSAPRRIKDLALPPKQNDSMRGRLGDGRTSLLDPSEAAEAVEGIRRYALINVWRNVCRYEPVRQYPLACVDAATTHFNEMRTFQIHYSDRVGENYFAAHDKKHKWWYFPEMISDEAMLIKQWDNFGSIAKGMDTDKELATFALHSSLFDASAPADSVDRESIEVRCVVIWEYMKE
mmetsp:Transcript_34434/g.75367  ORF Transcript_34434/g.75367 Transcript_34434/m.75367 type:complete len:373 (+) Transcript_34434:206-1324(+)